MSAEAPIIRAGLASALPPRATVVPRIATRLPRDDMALYLSAATVHDHRELVLAVVRGLTAAEECDDLSGIQGPPDDVLIGRAALGGWLQEQVGVVDPTSYPSDVVAALRRLPAEQRSSTLRTMFQQVWSCSPHVSLPAGSAP